MAAKNKAVPAAATETSGRVPLKMKAHWNNRRADSWMDARPAWGFSILDHAHSGKWSWGINQPDVMKIMEFLAAAEKRTWKEIRRDMAGGNRRRGEKHKFIPLSSVCKEAQDRLAELELDDQDNLFRFRLSGTERLWGVLLPDDHMFYILWWDPDHQVCPSADR